MMKEIFILLLVFLAFNISSQSNESKTIHDLQKNAVYVDLGGEGILGSVSYDRLFPLNDKNGVSLGIKAGFLLDIIVEANHLYGGPKHFIETGVGYSFPEYLFIPRIGYRYQATKGFLFRFGIMYLKSTQPDSFGDFPTAGLSFGYSF